MLDSDILGEDILEVCVEDINSEDNVNIELEPIDRVQLARHERRPYAQDLIDRLLINFQELHGDRKFRDDPAMITGFGLFHDRPVAIIGHQKGRDVRERQLRNFGMPKPEGYRKALRVMKIAEKFNRPVITLIDTPGAYPGIDAEERGQAEAIAVNLREMARLRVPIIVTITGEGGSGGALAIGLGDVVNIFENGVYSVISPEGCAAILWKDAARAPQAARSLRLTAPDLKAIGVVDNIIPEPPGGAHENWDGAAASLDLAIVAALAKVDQLSIEELLEARYQRFRRLGEIANA
ncbi:MAG: acetyl-CoA carboxylase carboxyltransferase subunit alpha [Acidobacteria bacterium]|nr:acetyl-CoA carboxylase carboxyltransferase subunit alpha [Acidobacteriota bacterium]